MAQLSTQIKTFIDECATWDSLNCFYIFSCICDSKTGHIYMRDIPKITGMRKPTIQRQCSKLSTDTNRHKKTLGLINITVDANDLRQRILTLTDRGVSLKNKMQQGV